MAKKKIKKAIKPAKKAVKKAVKKSAKKSGKPAKKKAAKKPVAKTAAPAKKTTSISPYINFKGNCEEAFNFYRSVFGGQFSAVNRFKEMPPMEGQPSLPAEYQEKLMHIALPMGNGTVLMGSDAPEGFGPPVTFGNNFGLSINPLSQAEADRLYNGLANGGQATMPMSKTFWGAYFGMLTDKFGINWMINFEMDQK